MPDFSLEVHLLEFSGDLYGEDLEVDFVARLREERRFPSIEALAAQIHADIVPTGPGELLAAFGIVPGSRVKWQDFAGNQDLSRQDNEAMWRYQAICHIAADVGLDRDRESRQEILRHLQESHGLGGPGAGGLSNHRRAPVRLLPGALPGYCTKCGRDFCAFHAGDIDGLCGGCI